MFEDLYSLLMLMFLLFMLFLLSVVVLVFVEGEEGFVLTEESYVDSAVKMRASTRKKETRRGLLQVAVPKQDAPISNFL